MSRTQSNPNSIRNLRYWSKGESGNPGGRPRGFVSAIRRQTKDGQELVHFAVRVLRDEQAEMRDRCWACGFLADRGFGRPTQSVALDLHEPMIPVAEIEKAARFVREKLDLYAGDGQGRPIVATSRQSESTVPENGRPDGGDPSRPVVPDATDSPKSRLLRELLGNGDPNV
jgi:hypothetical protein